MQVSKYVQYACMDVCTYIRIYVCMDGWMHVWMHACMDGMVWYGMVWYVMLCYVMVCNVVLCCAICYMLYNMLYVMYVGLCRQVCMYEWQYPVHTRTLPLMKIKQKLMNTAVW